MLKQNMLFYPLVLLAIILHLCPLDSDPHEIKYFLYFLVYIMTVELEVL